jgi:hypothetical protein
MTLCIRRERCDVCYKVGKPNDPYAMSLPLVLALAPVERWGIDFVSPINPSSHYVIYINVIW